MLSNKKLFVAFTRAVNSLKARETPQQEQICIKKHKIVKLQDTRNLAKGSQKRVQMMMQIAKRLRVLVPRFRAVLQSRHEQKEPLGRP